MRRTPLVVLVTVALALGGCNLASVAARSAAAVSRQAGPGAEQYWDYELAGDAMPASIMQLEGMVRVDPENHTLLLQLTRSYVGYAYGWVEDRADELERSQDFEHADEQRRRAKYMYLRARDLGLFLMDLKESGVNEAIRQGDHTFATFLARHFDDRGDAAVLFWTGSAWGSYIGASRDDPSAAADLPFARALVQRSVELDPTYQFGAGLAFLGALESSTVEGDIAHARELFDRAVAVSERRSLAVLVNMANTYAVQAGDRALYVSLLREVLEAGDVLPEARLSNRIAKRRAARYLRQVGERFPQ